MLLLFALYLCPGNASAAPEARAFFALPQFSQVTLSPSGEHIAALIATGGRQQLWVADADRTRSRFLAVPARVRDYTWVTDERLLLGTGEPGRAPGLAAVNRDGSGFRVLIAPLTNAGRHAGAVLLDLLPRQPAHVLVSLDQRLPHAADVYRLNIFSGERRLVAHNPGRVFKWMTDHSGRVRLKLAWAPMTNGLRYQLSYRPPGDTQWQTLHHGRPGGPMLLPLAFASDDQTLFVASSIGRDTAGIYRYSLSTQTLGEQIFAKPGVDVTQLQLSGAGQVGAVSFQGDRPGQQFLAPRWRARHERISQLLPGLETRIVSQSRDGDKAIVLAFSDRVAGRYYLFDAQSHALNLIGARRPWLEPESMARMRPVRFQTRDGLTLEGYLTLPAGGPGVNLPLIVYPHGGPWARDVWGFDPVVQFFAGHGFAILQVNFRGSAGYGRELLNAGRGEWGGGILKDLLDGVRWTIAQGIADEDRICILGSSFGGYAALMSAALYPQYYRCAVSFAAVTNLVAQIQGLRTRSNGRGFNEWRDMVGDPQADQARLVAASPMNYARAYSVPLLLGHGVRDERVDVSQAREFVKGLNAAGMDFEYLEFTQAAHGLADPDTRQLFCIQALKFISNALDDT